MRKTILAASTAAIALSAGATMARDASYNAIHNLGAAGQAPAHQNRVPPPKVRNPDFAVVNGDGSVARGRGVVSVNHIATGVYIVDFKHDKTGCAYVATVGLGGDVGTSGPGYATVVGANGDPNGVFMDTYNSSGSTADIGFHLVTIC